MSPEPEDDWLFDDGTLDYSTVAAPNQKGGYGHYLLFERHTDSVCPVAVVGWRVAAFGSASWNACRGLKLIQIKELADKGVLKLIEENKRLVAENERLSLLVNKL